MRFILVFCILAACNTPTLAFRDAPVQRVQVGKSTFDVRIKDGQAQAIRVNSEWAPNWKHTAARFYQAFRITSGCDVKEGSMVGDQALMQATLDCGGASAKIPRRHGGFDCSVIQPAVRSDPTPSIICDEIIPIATP